MKRARIARRTYERNEGNKVEKLIAEITSTKLEELKQVAMDCCAEIK